ncbi:MAG: hypothetical protein NXI21_19550 [Alphaproteobacteria bacterium]|nr:hypothetical protein [Alphaproteobacteria bacterium]
MKIEMGESIMVSWLKHVKNCQIIQSNWKPSVKTWESYQEEEVDRVFNSLKELFLEKYSMNVFNEKTSISQVIQQGEIDILGIEIRQLKIEKIYAIDIAFHENGLSYGDKNTTVSRVVKKIIRTAITLMSFFETNDGEIIFASPKINKSVLELLNPCVDELNHFFQKEKILNFNCRVISNHEFKSKIFDLVNDVSSSVSDTSELYLRGLQLTKLLNNTKKKKSELNGGFKSEKSLLKAIGERESEMKMGVLVRSTFKDLSENNILNDEIVKSLQDPVYSKEVLNNNYPVLKEVQNIEKMEEERKINGYFRYYSDPLRINNKNYLLSNNWYESNRESFLEWLIGIRETYGA